MSTDKFQTLKDALSKGDPAQIQTALPEPPHFISGLFALPQSQRDAIIAGVFPVLETEEDCWEIIEAAVQDTIARPQSNTILAIVPYIPERLLLDTRNLVQQIPNKVIVSATLRAIDERIKS